MKRLLGENETLMQINNNAGHPPAHLEFHKSMSQNFLRNIPLKSVYSKHNCVSILRISP